MCLIISRCFIPDHVQTLFFLLRFLLRFCSFCFAFVFLCSHVMKRRTSFFAHHLALILFLRNHLFSLHYVVYSFIFPPFFHLFYIAFIAIFLLFLFLLFRFLLRFLLRALHFCFLFRFSACMKQHSWQPSECPF